jgi:ketosteroid isomerase-like protein
MSTDEEHRNREFIRAIYDAAAAGDVGPLFDAMGPDFACTEADSLPWGGTYTGLAENRALVEQLARYLDFSRLTMHHYLVDRELVIAYGSVVWRGADRTEHKTIPLAEVWELRDGRAVSLKPFFWDTASFVPAKQGAAQ